MDEADWEFEDACAIAATFYRREDFIEKDGSEGFHREAMGHLRTACEATKISAPATVIAAIRLGTRGVGALAEVVPQSQ